MSKEELLSKILALANNHAKDGIEYVCGDLEEALQTTIEGLPEATLPKVWETVKSSLMARQGMDEDDYAEWEQSYLTGAKEGV